MSYRVDVLRTIESGIDRCVATKLQHLSLSPSAPHFSNGRCASAFKIFIMVAASLNSLPSFVYNVCSSFGISSHFLASTPGYAERDDAARSTVCAHCEAPQAASAAGTQIERLPCAVTSSRCTASDDVCGTLECRTPAANAYHRATRRRRRP